MRLGEIWQLDWNDIYLSRRYLSLHDSKNGTKRDVPLSTEAIRLVELLKPKSRGRVFDCNKTSAARSSPISGAGRH